MREILQFADRPTKPSCREPVWPAQLEVVRRKFFGNISRKNIGPRFTPDSLREHVIICAQFFFNASRERGSKFGVSATPTFFFNGKKEEGEQTLVNIDKLLAG